MSRDIKDRATAADGVNIPETMKSSADIEEILTEARIRLLMRAPFFGQLATRLQFVDATNWCPTAATDGRYFYYNRNFTDALNIDEVLYLVGHEVLHCVYDHMDPDRRFERDAQLWNMAADYVINLQLHEAHIGKKIELVDICFDYAYANMMTEDVYDILYDKAEKGQPMPQPLDIHMEGDPDDGDGETDAPGEGNNDGTDGPVKYSKAEKELLDSEVKESIKSAAAASAGGSLPSGVQQIIDDLLIPKVDWREYLAATIKSLAKNDYTWMVPSKKSGGGVILPGMDRDFCIRVAIAIDTSGSISKEMLKDFISEVYGIMGAFADFEVDLWCFDTGIHNAIKITPANIGDFKTYELGGFGGTDFDPSFDHMKKEGIEPEKFIMFTDGYPFGSWGDESYCETIFVVHGERGGKGPVAPWGETVPYDHPEKN